MKQLAIESEHLNGLHVLIPPIHRDERGFFMESFRADQFAALGLPTDFIQDNHSRSAKGVIRGLHFQWNRPMAKLMRVTAGTALLVAVDIRKGSPSLGQSHTAVVSAEDPRLVYAPPGFARGFAALSDWVEIQYKCTAVWNPAAESGILWNDPAHGIEWPKFDNTVLSAKDAIAQTLEQWLTRPESDTFRF